MKDKGKIDYGIEARNKDLGEWCVALWVTAFALLAIRVIVTGF